MKHTPLFIISLFSMLLGFESMFGQSKTTIKNSFVIHGFPTDIIQGEEKKMIEEEREKGGRGTERRGNEKR